MLGGESNFAIQMNRLFLKPIGVWPTTHDDSLISKVVRYISIVSCYLLISFVLIPCALHTFLEESNPNIRLKLIGPMSFNLMAIGKYCSLVGGIDKIAICFEHVEQDWKICRARNSKVS